MKMEIDDGLIQIVVLDISGVYAHIYDQALLPLDKVELFLRDYSNRNIFRIVVI